MPDLMPSRTLHVSIARPPDVVYEFITTPERFPEWAPGFALAVRPSGDAWVVETAGGEMALSLVERNALRVADHSVTIRPGLTVTNPIRVLANGDDAEVIFTLFRRPDVSAEEFEADAATVQSDLDTLKRVLESGSA
jgi:hypothetical protein